MRANLDVRLAEARIRQARAARRVAGAPSGPRWMPPVLYERSHNPSAAVETAGAGRRSCAKGSSGGTPPFRELFQAGLDASWELDVFGGTWRNLEAAMRISRPQWRTAANVLVTLMGDVGTNYINLRGFQGQIDIAWRKP